MAFISYKQRQRQLIPTNLNTLVPEDHLVAAVNDVVERLDIRPILTKYRDGGRGAFHPPNFSTIAHFRQENLKEIKGLFVQVLLICKEMGLVRMGHYFGIIKHIMKFRQFHLRGLEKAKAEWELVCLAYNIKKICIARAKK